MYFSLTVEQQYYKYVMSNSGFEIKPNGINDNSVSAADYWPNQRSNHNYRTNNDSEKQ
jgi:hypothetical protein